VGEAIALLGHARASIATALATLPLLRHRAVLANIVVTSLGARAEQAIASVRALLQREDAQRSAFSRWADRMGVLRFAQVITAVVLTVVTAAWSRVVRAATTGGSETAESETAESETGAEQAINQTPDVPTAPDLPSEPEVVAPPSESSPCGGCGNACSGCGNCGGGGGC
jgi:hypothetical protein